MVTIDGARMSVDEVRLALGVSRQRVSQIAQKCHWKAQRVGNIRLYRIEDVNQYLAERKTKYWRKERQNT